MAAKVLNFRDTVSANALETLANLQYENGIYIDAYIRHLNRLTDILFEFGEMGAVDLTKEEIFDLLVTNRSLCNDLSNLKR